MLPKITSLSKTTILAGDFRYSMYENALADALSRRGMRVVRHQFISEYPSLLVRAEAKYNVYGPFLYRLNQSFISSVTQVRPDVVFVWRGIHLRASTLRKMRRRASPLLVSYNVDDAFSPAYSSSDRLNLRRLWRFYCECIPEYDLHFVVRDQNVPELFSYGARAVLPLRRYFVPAIHRPVRLSEEERSRFESDVVFVGHYENDGRADYIRALLDAGVRVRLFGSRAWNQSFLSDITARVGAVREVFEDDYARAICGAKLALCFHSRLNRDEDTSRTYEIPACGTLLLSERTPLVETLYRTDEETVLFSSIEECVQKVKLLLQQPGRVTSMAAAGYRRVLANRCSIDDRAQEIESAVAERLEFAATFPREAVSA